MQLLELHRSSADPLHPALVSNVLRDKSGPDRDRVERSTTRSGFEADTARVYVPEDAERVAKLAVGDLTSSRLADEAVCR
jgi:hypothetical protein